jgi:hypothetical protein
MIADRVYELLSAPGVLAPRTPAETSTSVEGTESRTTNAGEPAREGM